jgi:phosphoribosylglycinamide formyltransferase-1
MKHIAIFASGGGSNAESILQHFSPHEEISISLIMTNNPNAGVIQRAHRWQVPCLVLNKKHFRDGGFLTKLMQQYDIDLIALAGYLKLIPTPLIQAFPQTILNIHPALLPKFGGKGMYGMNVHEAVILSGETHSGMTIHRVNERYDEGEILFQAKVAIQPDWDASTLQQEVLKLEHQHFAKTIENVLMC